MACWYPNWGYYTHPDNEPRKGVFCGRLTEYGLKFNREFYGDDFFIIPCGKCRGCRLDKARKWADRLLLELDDYPDALFLTMTYREGDLPMVTCRDGMKRPTLRVKDIQCFNKRLRKWYSDHKEGRKIRMYVAGEYGEKTWRPHYHGIYYNCNLLDFDDIKVWKDNPDLGTTLFHSDTLDKIWSNGNVLFAKASYNTFGYVARYTLKKQFMSDLGELYYNGRKPPFHVQSLKPALGTNFWIKNNIEFSRHNVYDGSEVHTVSLPRPVLDKLKLTNPDLYANLIEDRARFARANVTLLTNAIEMPYLDYLTVCESNFARRTAVLNRKDVNL